MTSLPFRAFGILTTYQKAPAIKQGQYMLIKLVVDKLIFFVIPAVKLSDFLTNYL